MSDSDELWRKLRARLYLRAPSFALPLGLLEPCVGDTETIGTDGKTVFYTSSFLSEACSVDPEQVVRLLAHTVIHCLLGHPFGKMPPDRERFKLACDIAAEYAVCRVLELPIPDRLLRVRESCPYGAIFSAERLYDLLPSFPAELTRILRAHPIPDDHELWQRAAAYRTRNLFAGNGDGDGELWRREGDKLRAALRSSLPTIGTGAGDRRLSIELPLDTGNAEAATASVLRRFSEVRENRHVNDAEFQYAWYTYGLEHYDGVPLIEPTEYSEERRLQELVIVIDTSASCSRGLTDAFLGVIHKVLCRDDLFFDRFKLYILQCDCELRQETLLTSPEELLHYMENLTLIGGGGTDYRPAFRRIEELRQRGELAHLRGILYFTDGYGVFPDEPPEYEAVFAMLGDRHDSIDLPPWAEELILDIPMGREKPWI